MRRIILFLFISIEIPFLQAESPARGLAQAISNDVLYSGCRHQVEKLFPGHRASVQEENGIKIHRFIDPNGVRREYMLYNQQPSNYLPSSQSCRLDSQFFNPERRVTNILRYDDNLNELRETEGNHHIRIITSPAGNYIKFEQRSLNDTTVSVYFKGPPEERITLPGYFELTSDLVENLKNGNKAYFRNLRSPNEARPTTPTVIK